MVDKLVRCDIDLIRHANAVMRMVEFLEAEAATAAPTSQSIRFRARGCHNRNRISIFELVYALRGWRRQCSAHQGYCAWAKGRSFAI